jgi:hypothetical protein
MLLLRHFARQGIDLLAYGSRTGRWWFPFVLVLLGLGAVLAVTAKAVIPSATYVLF